MATRRKPASSVSSFGPKAINLLKAFVKHDGVGRLNIRQACDALAEASASATPQATGQNALQIS